MIKAAADVPGGDSVGWLLLKAIDPDDTIVSKGSETCPACDGAGHPVGSVLPCRVCKGTSVIDHSDVIKQDVAQVEITDSSVDDEDDEGEQQSRHPDTGQFITDEELEELESDSEKATGAERDQINGRIVKERLRKMYETGDTKVMKATVTTSATMPELIQRLEKAIADPDLDPALRQEAGELITHHRLRAHFEGRAQKGAVQDALHGTAEPEIAGHLDSGKSGLSGKVVTGAGPTRDNPALTLGGESTAQIPVEAKVVDNPPAPVTTDAAGIVPAAAGGSALDALARQRQGEDVTKQRLTALFALKGALALLGGANNGGDVVPAATARASASDVNSIPDGGSISPEYLAKCERDLEKAIDVGEKMRLGVIVTRGRLQRRYSRVA